VAGSSNDPATAALAAKVNQTSTAVDALHSTTQDWSQWSTAHYDKRNLYGSVDAMGASITRFETLQYNLGSLSNMLNEQVARLSRPSTRPRLRRTWEPCGLRSLPIPRRSRGQVIVLRRKTGHGGGWTAGTSGGCGERYYGVVVVISRKALVACRYLPFWNDRRRRRSTRAHFFIRLVFIESCKTLRVSGQ
jgi:hypothetical protein